jgi:hypothetical protein
MISRVHSQLGTAGLIVAVIALVVALAGGAYAASGGLSAKQKRQVKKIARTEAEKLVKAGPQGPPGPPGAPGKDGSNGSNGSDGSNVVAANEPAGVKCTSGGVSFEVEGSGTKRYACNGQTGFVEALPSGSSLKGVFSAADEGSTTPMLTPISFGIEISPTPTAVFVLAPEFALVAKPDGTSAALETAKAVEEVCPGDAAAPEAEPGYVCVYIDKAQSAEFDTPALLAGWAKPTEYGVSVPLQTSIGGAEPGFIRGTWAVTAE